MGGIKIRVIGRTVIAIVTAPSTMKEMVRTSDSKPGRRSSLLPTSAENLSKILPCKENILYSLVNRSKIAESMLSHIIISCLPLVDQRN
jgi:hypothetical protein